MTVIGSMTNHAFPAGYRLGQGTAKPEGTQDFAGALLEKLKDEASKTPMERARDRVLEKKGLSEADYQQMSAESRSALDAEIKEAIQRTVEQTRENGASQTGTTRFA